MLSQKTAERYMNLKEGWPKVEQAVREGKISKIDTVSNLSFRQAMLIINPPKENSSDKYDEVQNLLIKKLEKMELTKAELVATNTKKELDDTITAMKVAQFEKTQKA